MSFSKRALFILFGLFLILGVISASVSAQIITQVAKNEDLAVKEKIDSKPASVSQPVSNFSRVGVSQADTVPLSLNEAIRRALESNNEIEIARDDVRYQETQLRSLLGTYDPVLSVTPVYSRNASTGQTASNDFRVDAGVFKQIRPGGGTINSFFNTSQSGSTSSNNPAFNQTIGLGTSSNTTYFSNLGVTYTQPLFRNFQIDNTRRQIKIQRRRLQQSDADFRRRTIEIIARVQRSYWDLVFAMRDQQNRLANLNLARENLRQIEARIEAGASAPLARAEVATELANRESDVLVATQQVSITENNLKTLILRNPTAPEWTVAVVPTDNPVFSLDPLNLDLALKDAIDNRPELRRLRLQKEITAVDIDFFRNQTKPQIDLNSTFSLGGLSLGRQNTGGATSFPLIFGNPNQSADAYLLSQIEKFHPNQLDPIPQVAVQSRPDFFNGGTFQSLQNLFRSDAPSYSVGVTFSFPIGNRTAKANLAGARILQEQTDAQMRSQEQIVIAEVRNAVQAVETARQRVLAAQRAVANAEIQLEGERKLFDVGRSTTFLLFQRENTLTNARNSLIRAQTDYNKSLADLQQATSTTFVVNNIEVDSPMEDQE